MTVCRTKLRHFCHQTLLAMSVGFLVSKPLHAAAYELNTLNICDKQVSHTERLRISPVARPPFMRLFKEPGFKTPTRRISDSSKGVVVKPAGNPAPSWNIDESLLLLYRYAEDSTVQILLLDGQNYEEKQVLNLPDLASENLFWSHTDRAIAYFVSDSGDDAGQLIQLNIESMQRSVIADFAPMCQQAGFSANEGVLAKPSFDDNLFGYRCGIDRGKSLAIAYNRQSNDLHSLRIGSGEKIAADSAPSPSPDANHFWLHGQLFDAKLQLLRTIDSGDPSAAHTLAQRLNGENVLFQVADKPSPRGCNGDLWDGIGLIVEHSLAEDQCKPFINQTDSYGGVPEGTELFASAYRSPNWMAMATVGYEDIDFLTNKAPAPLLTSEIYLVNTRADRVRVCRLAHHRSFGDAARNASYDPSLGSPNVTLSPTATRVLFASDWYDSGFVDTYVLELPTFTLYSLAGRWVDEFSPSVVTEFVQRGEKLEFVRVDDNADSSNGIQTTGSGEISGNKIQLEYVVAVSDVRKVPGICDATITGKGAGNAKNIVLSCQDNYFGRFRTTLIRER
ncbi:MAG: hypothetical protein KTR32_32265 [Granulosicoccus sp.]|nr:hypothetical protein [Granulosicoccus sp.]